MTSHRLRRREYRRAAALGVAGLLACTTPEPSDGATATDGSTANSTDASTGSGTSSSGSTGGSTGSGAPTTGASTTGTSGEATSGSTTDAPDTSTGGSTGGAGPSFTEVYETIFMANNCLSGYCHGGMAGGLEMTDEATAYANLVEVDATTGVCGLSVRVVPGAPEESILWRRARPAALDAGDMCAPKMPQGTMGLTDPEAQLVYDWIAAGALE